MGMGQTEATHNKMWKNAPPLTVTVHCASTWLIRSSPHPISWNWVIIKTFTAGHFQHTKDDDDDDNDDELTTYLADWPAWKRSGSHGCRGHPMSAVSRPRSGTELQTQKYCKTVVTVKPSHTIKQEMNTGKVWSGMELQTQKYCKTVVTVKPSHTIKQEMNTGKVWSGTELQTQKYCKTVVTVKLSHTIKQEMNTGKQANIICS